MNMNLLEHYNTYKNRDKVNPSYIIYLSITCPRPSLIVNGSDNACVFS